MKHFAVLTAFFIISSYICVVHTKGRGNNFYKIPNWTLDKCAQSCMEEKLSKCKYFKFVDSTSMCYLSPTQYGGPAGGHSRKLHGKVKGQLGALKKLKNNISSLKKSLMSKIEGDGRQDSGIHQDRKLLRAHGKALQLIVNNMHRMSKTLEVSRQFQRQTIQKIRQLFKSNPAMFKNGSLNKFKSQVQRKMKQFQNRINNFQRVHKRLWKRLQKMNRSMNKNNNKQNKKLQGLQTAISRLWKKLSNKVDKVGSLARREAQNSLTKAQQANIWNNLKSFKSKFGSLQGDINDIFGQELNLETSTKNSMKSIQDHLGSIDDFDYDVNKEIHGTEANMKKAMTRLAGVLRNNGEFRQELMDDRQELNSLKNHMREIENSKDSVATTGTTVSAGMLKALKKVHVIEKQLIKAISNIKNIMDDLTQRMSKDETKTRKIMGWFYKDLGNGVFKKVRPAGQSKRGHNMRRKKGRKRIRNMRRKGRKRGRNMRRRKGRKRIRNMRRKGRKRGRNMRRRKGRKGRKRGRNMRRRKGRKGRKRGRNMRRKGRKRGRNMRRRKGRKRGRNMRRRKGRKGRKRGRNMRKKGRKRGRNMRRRKGRKHGRNMRRRKGRKRGRNMRKKGRKRGRNMKKRGRKVGRRKGKKRGRKVGKRKGKKRGRKVGRRKGKKRGRKVGRRKGKKRGRKVGRRKGKKRGRKVGRRKGKKRGRKVGRRKGKKRGRKMRRRKGKKRGRKVGRRKGKKRGRKVGRRKGKKRGRKVGRRKGKKRGRKVVRRKGIGRAS